MILNFIRVVPPPMLRVGVNAESKLKAIYKT